KATSSAVTIIVATNSPPLIEMKSPTNGARFFAPAALTIEASASDSDGNVTQVEFFLGAASLGTSATSPYTNLVPVLDAGDYEFRAIAMDNQGASATS